MRPAVALLPSALLGPAVWRPVAQRLASRGWEVVELPWVATAPDSPAAQLESYLDALPADRPLVLVPHSNAGLFVPAMTSARRVEAVVFVDAGVPPRQGSYELAPRKFYAFLQSLADAEGLLPVWTSWWGEDVAGLFPDDETRARIEAEQRRLPLDYLAGSMTAPAGWDHRRAAFLAFGDTYESDRADAASRGWAVTTLLGDHLHMLVDPDTVASTLDDLLKG